MRISDWSSDVCSSDLAKLGRRHAAEAVVIFAPHRGGQHRALGSNRIRPGPDQRQTEFGIGEPTAFVALDIDRTAKVVALQQAVRARKRVVEGTSVSVRVGLGGRPIIKNKNNTK